MFCTNCGNASTPEQKFCTECGTTLIQDDFSLKNEIKPSVENELQRRKLINKNDLLKLIATKRFIFIASSTFLSLLFISVCIISFSEYGKEIPKNRASAISLNELNIITKDTIHTQTAVKSITTSDSLNEYLLGLSQSNISFFQKKNLIKKALTYFTIDALAIEIGKASGVEYKGKNIADYLETTAMNDYKIIIIKKEMNENKISKIYYYEE